MRGIVAAGDIAKWYNGFTVLDSPKEALINRLHFLSADGLTIHCEFERSGRLLIIG